MDRFARTDGIRPLARAWGDHCLRAVQPVHGPGIPPLGQTPIDRLPGPRAPFSPLRSTNPERLFSPKPAIENCPAARAKTQRLAHIVPEALDGEAYAGATSCDRRLTVIAIRNRAALLLIRPRLLGAGKLARASAPYCSGTETDWLIRDGCEWSGQLSFAAPLRSVSLSLRQ